MKAAPQPTRSAKTPTAECTLRADAERFTQLSRESLATLRRLRRNLRHCEACAASASGECAILSQLHATVTNLITELTAEWGIDDHAA